MHDPNVKQIYAKAIGDLVISHFEAQGSPPVLDVVENRALTVIAQIKTILDDATLDDSDCYERIEAIVEEFYASGLSTSRHDWG